MVDCSHANSNKDHNLQPLVAENVANQIVEGNKSIIGIMIESNIEAGNQKIKESLSEMTYGVSVTDACIDWAATETLLTNMSKKIGGALSSRK
jgi:3-deoxy-7-phosphoheptulonate synthase